MADHDRPGTQIGGTQTGDPGGGELEHLRARVETQRATIVELRELVDTIPDALIVIGEDGRIELVNRQAESLFGYSRGELLGTSIEQLLPHRFRQAHGEHRQHFAASPHVRPMGSGLELFGLHRDGREIPVEISLSPIRLDGRKLFASAIRDVTTRVEIEGRLREAREKAEFATASKARFVAAASHDLRQPLQAASIYLDLATNEALDKPQQEDALDKTRRCVRTLTSLLSKIMHVSRLDAGAVEPHRSDHPVRSLLERMRDHYAPEAAGKGLELRIVDSAAMLHSDPVLLQQLMENLVANAVRYTDSGGVLIGCRRRGNGLVLQVWDTGVGIAEGDQRAIFEEFRRLGGRGADASLGMGLGLAIVKRLGELLGHEINVRSRPGRGTLFEVAVPGGRGAGATARPATAKPDAGARTGLIAVVDDDTEVLRAIQTILEVSGHAVVGSTSLAGLREGLRGFDSAPDAILTDYRVGEGETGLEVIEALRREYGAALPAVVLTGDSSFSMLEGRAGEIGFDLLAKPVVTERLLEVLARRIAARAGDAETTD
jgi:PAS domain S-box-containing protein